MKTSQNYKQKIKKLNTLYWIAVSIFALAFAIAGLVIGEENPLSASTYICVFCLVVGKVNEYTTLSDTDG
jgi:hypothetical protein